MSDSRGPIRHFTDPGCPCAFSAERQRLRLLWLYGDQIDWELHMVVLAEEAPEDFTPERLSGAYRALAAAVRDADRLARAAASDAPPIHACRAVVAARLRWPEREAAMLRRLRVLAIAGELLDDSDTLELAAEQAGLPVAELAAYCAEPEVEEALRADMGPRARPRPPRAPRTTSSAGPRRSAATRARPTSCCARPTRPRTGRPPPRRPARLPPGRGLRGGDRQPRARARRAAPILSRADEVLEWAGVPLATAEVAAVLRPRHRRRARASSARAARVRAGRRRRLLVGLPALAVGVDVDVVDQPRAAGALGA